MMSMMPARLAALAALLLVTRFADAQVLHERVTVGGVKCANGVCWKEGRTRLRVLGADKREATRDAFWGSIVIDFEPGRWIPLPSVAAEARILAARVEPEVEVSFAHDGADNEYVMSTAGGRHRLVWLTDA